jgi:hypothetical protein
MTLKNASLIQIITALGEDVVLEKLRAKMKHDAQQKSYHKQYNAKKNILYKSLRELAEDAGLTVEQYLQRINNTRAAK